MVQKNITETKTLKENWEWLQEAIRRFYLEIKITPSDPRFPEAGKVFGYLLGIFLIPFERNEKLLVHFKQPVAFIRSCRYDEFYKRFHSALCTLLETDVKSKFPDNKNKDFLFSELVKAYADQPQNEEGKSILECLLGSQRNKGLTAGKIKYLISNKKLFKTFTEVSLVVKVLAKMESNTRTNISNFTARLESFFNPAPSLQQTSIDMQSLMQSITSKKELKKPSTVLENLLCAKSFFKKIEKHIRTEEKGKYENEVTSLLKVNEFLKNIQSSHLWKLETISKPRRHKDVDYDDFVFIS